MPSAGVIFRKKEISSPRFSISGTRDPSIPVSRHLEAYGHEYKEDSEIESCITCKILFSRVRDHGVLYLRKRLWLANGGYCGLLNEKLLLPYSEIEHDGTCKHLGRRGSRIGKYCCYCVRGLVCRPCNRLISYYECLNKAELSVSNSVLDTYLKKRPMLDEITNWWLAPTEEAQIAARLRYGK